VHDLTVSYGESFARDLARSRTQRPRPANVADEESTPPPVYTESAVIVRLSTESALLRQELDMAIVRVNELQRTARYAQPSR
jgi:hypothetical protein